MQESTNREQVLKKVRAALISKTKDPFPGHDYEPTVFEIGEDISEVVFAKNLKDSGGEIIFNADEIEFAEKLFQLVASKGWKELFCSDIAAYDFLKKCGFNVNFNSEGLVNAHAAISCCEYLIARTGSVVMSSAMGRLTPFFSPVHIVVAFSNQILSDFREVFTDMRERFSHAKPSSVSFITGVSKTADINNETVKGAQGPSELYVFIIDKDGW